MGVASQNSTLPCAIATSPVSLPLSSPGDVWPRLFFGGGVEKVIWPPNTITRQRREKKKTRFFRFGAEKYDFRAPKPIFGFGRRKTGFFRSAEKTNKRRLVTRPSRFLFEGAENFYEGVEKVRRTP